jgi:AcrR family transcriptional regulator
MNHAATSREEIVDVSLRLAAQQGFKALSIRNIAEKCNVSVGCVYRYFPSKTELISAAVEKIWESIFRLAQGEETEDFCECVRRIFRCICNGCSEYPSFFSRHSEVFSESEKSGGRRVMDKYLIHIRKMLLDALDADMSVKHEVFDDEFTEEKFIDFVFDNLIFIGIRQEKSCDVLISVINKSVK